MVISRCPDACQGNAQAPTQHLQQDGRRGVRPVHHVHPSIGPLPPPRDGWDSRVEWEKAHLQGCRTPAPPPMKIYGRWRSRDDWRRLDRGAWRTLDPVTSTKSRLSLESVDDLQHSRPARLVFYWFTRPVQGSLQTVDAGGGLVPPPANVSTAFVGVGGGLPAHPREQLEGGATDCALCQ